MGSIPGMRGAATPPEIRVVDPKAPKGAAEAVQNFSNVAAQAPESLQEALWRNGSLASPTWIMAEAELGDANKERQWALGVLAKLMDNRFDMWAEYDRETADRIEEAKEADDISPPRTIAIAEYLGRVIEWWQLLESGTTALSDKQAA